MTFDEVVSRVSKRLNQTSAVAITRIGETCNDVYKKVTSSIGLNVSRRTEVQADATIGSQFVTFSDIEKVISVIDKSSGSNRFLDEVMTDELDRGPIAESDAPTRYAVYRSNAGSVQIKLNVIAQTAFTLYAPAYVLAPTLSGVQEPAFPESFHDIIVSGALYEEYMKLEKASLAAQELHKYEDRLGDLRLFIATSPQQDIYRGKMAGSSSGNGSTGGGTGGSTSTGGTSYTQTGLITFNRTGAALGSRYPFAVAAGSEVVANLNADLLDGLDSTAFLRVGVGGIVNADIATGAAIAYSKLNLAASIVNADVAAGAAIAYSKLNLATSIVNADIGAAAAIAYSKLNLAGNIVNADVNASAAIAWSKINKTGSSLADLTTVSAAAITSGILPDARIPGLTTDGVSRITALAFKAAQVASSDVNTLDDYEEGTWTPTLTNLTLGNGTLTCTYVKIGKWVWFTIALIWGSTTSASGTFGFSTPFTGASATGGPTLGQGLLLDSGVASYPAQVGLTTTTRVDIFAFDASSTYLSRVFVNATVPFTWGNLDEVRVQGCYEANQ